MIIVREFDREQAANDLSAEPVAVKALTPTDADTVVAMENDRYVGATSYRVVDGSLKIINIGVTRRRQGIGSFLLRHILSENEHGQVWCNALLDAVPFYEAHGMRKEVELSDGRWKMVKL